MQLRYWLLLYEMLKLVQHTGLYVKTVVSEEHNLGIAMLDVFEYVGKTTNMFYFPIDPSPSLSGHHLLVGWVPRIFDMARLNKWHRLGFRNLLARYNYTHKYVFHILMHSMHQCDWFCLYRLYKVMVVYVRVDDTIFMQIAGSQNPHSCSAWLIQFCFALHCVCCPFSICFCALTISDR